MRKIFICSSVLAAIVLVTCANGCLAQERQTFTRKEVLALSPKDLAVRVLGSIATEARAKELKFYISPVLPTPPWLEMVEVDMPVIFNDRFSICESDRFVVRFLPVDMGEANKHLLDRTGYDPPTEISNIEQYLHFAGLPEGTAKNNNACGALPAEQFFQASSPSDASRALAAFKLFHIEANWRRSQTEFSCQDLPKHVSCDDSWRKEISAFSKVLSIQDEIQSDGTHIDTIVLLPGHEADAGPVNELWLTVQYGRPDVTLLKAKYVLQWPPPVF